jgi:bacterioferritin
LEESSIRGLQNEPLRELYRKEIPDEVGHAQYLADKIAILGGTPVAEPNLTPPPSGISQMIENDLAAEDLRRMRG